RSAKQPRQHYDTELPASIPTLRRKGTGWKLPTIIGMVLIIGLIMFWQQVVMPWWTEIQDQWHYGDTHITQFNADVGHGGVSHFIAEYYNHEIVVIEISQTNPNTLHVYTLTGFYGETGTPVIQLAVQ